MRLSPWWGASLLGLTACAPTAPEKLYPYQPVREADYLCRLAYTEPYDQNQAWTRKRPVMVVVHAQQATVYFENDQTQNLPLEPGLVIPPGTYPCPQG